MQGGFERGECADVDDAVVDGELVEVDELEGGGRGVRGDGRVGQHVDADVAVLRDAGDEPGHLGEGAVEFALGVGEVVGCLGERLARFGHFAVLQVFEAVEEAEVAVAGGGAGLCGGDAEPGDGDCGEDADTDGAPHDPLADVLASADEPGDADDAHRGGGDDRRGQEELVPLQAQRDLHDGGGDDGTDDRLIGAVPSDPGAAGERDGGQDDPDERAGERSDEGDARPGHERPPRRRCPEPGDESGECGDEDDVGAGGPGGGGVGQHGQHRGDGRDDGDHDCVGVRDRVPPGLRHRSPKYHPPVPPTGGILTTP